MGSDEGFSPWAFLGQSLPTPDFSVRGSGFLNPRDCSGARVEGFKRVCENWKTGGYLVQVVGEITFCAHRPQYVALHRNSMSTYRVENSISDRLWCEPPHSCGGRSASALRERISKLIMRFSAGVFPGSHTPSLALIGVQSLGRTTLNYRFAAALSIDFHSSGDNCNLPAAIFSSRCFTEDVPGMGSITGE
jgi:hypothetical protein